ncbi:hypothetical protein V1293_002906 [Bradyrhizobium sp. AZCC 1693]
MQGVEVIVVSIPFAKYPDLANLYDECFAETAEYAQMEPAAATSGDPVGAIATLPICHANLTLLFRGSSRTRFPVRAKMAFASAGAAGGTGGSPIPRTSLPSCNPLTMISGA